MVCSMSKSKRKGAKRQFKRAATTSSGCSGQKKACTAYSPAHRILVIGDGDFSFSRGLVHHVGGGQNITATSYDSYDEVVNKYGHKAQTCIAACAKAGATVQHRVDATKLQQHFVGASFPRVVFNFPHTGDQRVHANKALLAGFLTSSRPLLTPGGEVHVTIKDQLPYSGWDVPRLAQEAGFVHYSTTAFDFAQFPDYAHQTTVKGASHLEVDSPEAKRLIKTFVFRRNTTAASPPQCIPPGVLSTQTLASSAQESASPVKARSPKLSSKQKGPLTEGSKQKGKSQKVLAPVKKKMKKVAPASKSAEQATKKQQKKQLSKGGNDNKVSGAHAGPKKKGWAKASKKKAGVAGLKQGAPGKSAAVPGSSSKARTKPGLKK